MLKEIALIEINCFLLVCGYVDILLCNDVDLYVKLNHKYVT